MLEYAIKANGIIWDSKLRKSGSIIAKEIHKDNTIFNYKTASGEDLWAKACDVIITSLPHPQPSIHNPNPVHSATRMHQAVKPQIPYQ